MSTLDEILSFNQPNSWTSDELKAKAEVIELFKAIFENAFKEDGVATIKERFYMEVEKL